MFDNPSLPRWRNAIIALEFPLNPEEWGQSAFLVDPTMVDVADLKPSAGAVIKLRRSAW